MRFIGNKENLVDKIHYVMQIRGIEGNSFFDFFSGTTSVSRYFKWLDYQIFSSDLLYFSYVLQRAYISNNKDLMFEKLLDAENFKISPFFDFSPLIIVIDYLNSIDSVEGFIFKNYTPDGTSELEIPRMYFSNQNGKIIDAIRQKIEYWKNKNLITDDEYFVLLACLIETVSYYANISGVYAAFSKNFDDPRTVKKLILKPIKIIKNSKENFSFNENSVNLINKIKADIFYLDPPYNQRQYAPNYHLLETIAKYDNPKIKGVAGLRDYENQKSEFCNADTAIKTLSKIAKESQYKFLILSYNTEGIMQKEKIISELEQYGKVELVEFKYLRFKNNGRDEEREKFVNEQLYILKKHE